MLCPIVGNQRFFPAFSDAFLQISFCKVKIAQKVKQVNKELIFLQSYYIYAEMLKLATYQKRRGLFGFAGNGLYNRKTANRYRNAVVCGVFYIES